MEKTIKELATELRQDLRAKVEDIKSLDLGTWKGKFALVVIVVRYVESLAKNQHILKEDKKELAVEIIDQEIDIPYIPDSVESPLVKFVVRLLIDQVVETLNRTLGKLWIEKLN